MKLAYADKLDTSALTQGDVLARTDDLNAALKETHPHIYEKEENRYFMILTQTCDLVLRGEGVCKTPYINLAPVRALASVVKKQIALYASNDIDIGVPIIRASAKSKLSEFMNRLINNNESTYFYLDGDSMLDGGDMVAILNQSITLKADSRYQTCLNAKKVQLSEPFQAKLGWLIGQIYSRVGTQDWEPKLLTKKVNEVLNQAALTIDDEKMKALEKIIVEDPSVKTAISDQRTLTNQIKKLPTKKQNVISNIAAIMSDVMVGIDPAIAKKIVQRIENDATIATLLR